MGEESKTYDLRIRTTADPKPVKEITAAVTAIKPAAQGAQQSTLDLAAAHKKAGEAAHGHAHDTQSLRTAAQGAKEAGWAFAAFQRGDYVTAMHEAKFATLSLNAAVSANPMAIWVAAGTLAITVLSHFATGSADAGDAADELTKKANEASEKWKGLHQSIEAARLTLLASLDPMEKQYQAMQKMNEAARDQAKHYGDVEEAAKKARAAVELLIESYSDQVKKIEAQTQAERALGQEKAKHRIADVDVRLNNHEINEQQAAELKNRINHDSSLEDINSQEAQFHKNLDVNTQTAGASTLAVERAQRETASAAAEYKNAGNEEWAQRAMKDFKEQGGSIDAWNKGDYQSVAKDSRDKYLATAPANAFSEAEGKMRYEAMVRLGKAYVDLQEKQRASMALDQQDAEAQAKLKTLRDAGALQIPVWNERRATIAAQATADEAKRVRDEELERRKWIGEIDKEALASKAAKRDAKRKEIDSQITNTPLSADDELAAEMDLSTKRSTPRTLEEESRNKAYQKRQKLRGDRNALDLEEAKVNPDYQESLRRQNELRDRERTDAWNRLPPDTRIAREALDATNQVQVPDGSQVSDLKNHIRDVAQHVASGQRTDGDTAQIVSMMRDFLLMLKQLQAPGKKVDRIGEELRRMQQDVELMKKQQKNGGA